MKTLEQLTGNKEGGLDHFLFRSGDFTQEEREIVMDAVALWLKTPTKTVDKYPKKEELIGHLDGCKVVQLPKSSSLPSHLRRQAFETTYTVFFELGTPIPAKVLITKV